MEEVLTAAEITVRFDSGWVLIGDPETDESPTVRHGTVLWHSKDRDEVHRKAVALRPRRFAILYTGQIPEDCAVVL